MEVSDPLHTLMSVYSAGDSCGLGCVENYTLNDPLTGKKTNLGPVWYMSLDTSPGFNDGCHWLIGGNANRDQVIDILDFVLWKDRNGNVVSADTPCGTEGVSADFDGTGVVDAADFSFVVINFLESNKERRDDLCAGASGAAVQQPRTCIIVRELIGMGTVMRPAELMPMGTASSI